MSGLAIITEACIDVKDRACVDVCPVQCIYEFDPKNNALFSEEEAGSGITENTHQPTPEVIALFEDSILYVNTEECTSCTACYQPDVCPVGAIYSEENVPDGASGTHYNSEDPNKGHDHTFFIQLSRDVFCRLDRYRSFVPSELVMTEVRVGGVWPPVAVADGHLARGVALNDWGDRPPTAATSPSPASPTVRRIASKR